MNPYTDKSKINSEISSSIYFLPVITVFMLTIATDIGATNDANESKLQPLNTEPSNITKPSIQNKQKSKKIKSDTSTTAKDNEAIYSPSRMASGKIRKSDEVKNATNLDIALNHQNQSMSNGATKNDLHQNNIEISNISNTRKASAVSLLTPKADKGNPLRIGNILLKPSLRISYGHDDNVNRAPDNKVKVDSAVVKTAVGLAADIEHKGDTYRLDYEGELQKYLSSSIDNIEIHTLNLKALNVLNSRNSVIWNLGLLQGADPRGSTDATLNVSSPSEYRRKTIKGTYIYGVEGSRGRLELDGFASNKRYLNNRETMDKADVDSLGLAGRFFVRIMPKTSVFLDLRRTEFDYKESTAQLGSVETNYLAGISWNTTAATTGSFRVGHTTRDYKDRSDFSGMSWETGITWKPRTYSTFNFSAMRNVSDTVGGASSNVGNYILNSTYEARWSHEWRHNLNSRLGWRHIQSDYDGIDRKDTQDTISADLHYKLRPQVDIGVEMNWSDRKSSLDQYDYERRLLMGVVEFKY